MFGLSTRRLVRPSLTIPFEYSTLSFRIGIIVADAGCILEAMSEYLAPHNYIMPLDLGAKGRYARADALCVANTDMTWPL